MKCGKLLTAGKETEHDGEPYCKNCYGKYFGPKGKMCGETVAMVLICTSVVFEVPGQGYCAPTSFADMWV